MIVSIVLEYKIGNATIRIHDDYCKDKTPEEVRKILCRIANYVQDAVISSESHALKSEKVFSM